MAKKAGKWALCKRCGCPYWKLPGGAGGTPRTLCQRCLLEAILDKMVGKEVG